jgi:hypothetical protein
MVLSIWEIVALMGMTFGAFSFFHLLERLELECRQARHFCPLPS